MVGMTTPPPEPDPTSDPTSEPTSDSAANPPPPAPGPYPPPAPGPYPPPAPGPNPPPASGPYPPPAAGAPPSAYPPAYPGYDPYAKSRLVAGLLGIFLGGLGIHRFYLGYTGIGVAQIFVTIFTCGIGSLWGLIEGIMILANSGITTDAQGRPLRE